MQAKVPCVTLKLNFWRQGYELIFILLEQENDGSYKNWTVHRPPPTPTIATHAHTPGSSRHGTWSIVRTLRVPEDLVGVALTWEPSEYSPTSQTSMPPFLWIMRWNQLVAPNLFFGRKWNKDTSWMKSLKRKKKRERPFKTSYLIHVAVWLCSSAWNG